MSPSWPPVAAVILRTDNELNTYWACTGSSDVLMNLTLVLALVIVDIVPPSTLAVTPPPVKYLTVNVVLDGAIP